MTHAEDPERAEEGPVHPADTGHDRQHNGRTSGPQDRPPERLLRFVAAPEHRSGPTFGRGSPYPELLWLPVLGPGGYLLWRRLALELDNSGAGFEIAAADLAASLGLGLAPVRRILSRLERFGVLAAAAETYLVTVRLPPLANAQLRRLQRDRIRLHDHLIEQTIQHG